MECWNIPGRSRRWRWRRKQRRGNEVRSSIRYAPDPEEQKSFKARSTTSSILPSGTPNQSLRRVSRYESFIWQCTLRAFMISYLYFPPLLNLEDVGHC